VSEPRLIRVLTRKWPDSPHWEYDALRLGMDEYGEWVGLPLGTRMSRPGVTLHASAAHVVLLPHGAWWVATFYGDDPERPVDTYVDIATPWRWNHDESEARAVDLDLDVIKGTTGRVWVDDEDEFAEHRVSLGYPPDVVEQAVGACADVERAVTGQAGPFAGAHLDWLARLRTLTN
jgi:predicted RNA-binding protein associated with RNAse of E/G family